MAPHRRLNWEFYAVVGGQLAAVVDGARGVFRSDSMWVFPAGSVHGWTGRPGCECEVFVFHFDAVPLELERRVRLRRGLVVSLSGPDKELLKTLHARLEPHYRTPVALSELHFNNALIELSLTALEKHGESDGESPMEPVEPTAKVTTSAMARVLTAENWYQTHLASHPSLSDVARACGVSPGHLRRLFYEVRRESPRLVFEGIRMRRAMHLLAHSDEKLAAIALECGYAGASQLCQAFRSRLGASPTSWRRFVYSQYRHPAATGSPAAAREERELAHAGG